MKTTKVFVLLIVPVNFLRAWDIKRACNPGNESPISPSISARGVKAATESITTRSTDPDFTNASTISSACSPVSGCDTRSSFKSTPSFFAYCVSNACSASTKAQIPPIFCISLMTWRVNVVFPDDSGPKISTTLPRGRPPTPNATSKLKDPVDTAGIFSTTSVSPNLITEPFPNCLSI